MTPTILLACTLGILVFARHTPVGEALHSFVVVNLATWLNQRASRIAAHVVTALFFVILIIGGVELLFLSVDVIFVIGFVDFSLFTELAILLSVVAPLVRLRMLLVRAVNVLARAAPKWLLRTIGSGRRKRYSARRLRPSANDNEEDGSAVLPVGNAA
jgi:hypothetical protein